MNYPVRVRDLLHGFVYLTELEVSVINHQLFQRLRHVRQNDVAFSVYPSLNTSRFEHSLGCTVVAGKMATNLLRSPLWSKYKRAAGVSEHDFEQVCRLYALLHDVGHLPLSHLFETAFQDYAPERSIAELCEEWFGGKGFTKPHEACGSVIGATILDDVSAPTSIKNSVLKLLHNKRLERSDPLLPIKLLVDSEIDADRIDATARDGLLAGGEYGTYDIDRLCTAVFLQETAWGWTIAYSHKALGSLEALLLDRYRTHTWIHYHHQVVAMKSAIRGLIARLLKEDVITRASFPTSSPADMALRDDVWLWSFLRHPDNSKLDNSERAMSRLALYRDKSRTKLVWKDRTTYRDLIQKVLRQVGCRTLTAPGRRYEAFLSDRLGSKAVVFNVNFRPVGDEVVSLTTDDGRHALGDLLRASRLTASLRSVWAEEPQFYVIVFGEAAGKYREDELHRRWVETTSEWLAEGA